ncbi:unnamed protein product [Symbiodinium sp. CCMP2592]|nr:unnamed protein product [Symbiodinium sp. CCMP2592]
MSAHSSLVNIEGTMSLDAAGTATIRLTKTSPTSSNSCPSATTTSASKGLDLFPVDKPPSSEFILGGIENNAFEFHPSKRNLSSRQVYVMLYNIQGRLGLMKGMDGGWSITASKQLLDMLKKAKNRSNQATSSSSAPLAIGDKDQVMAIMDQEGKNDEDKETVKATSDSSSDDGESNWGDTSSDEASKNSGSASTASTPSPVDLSTWTSDWHDTYVCALDLVTPRMVENSPKKKRIMNKVLRTIKKAKNKFESL